jgi:UPF0176 protein
VSHFLTAAFYRFVALDHLSQRRQQLLAQCEALGVRGLILLAAEGINGTVAGEPDAVRKLLVGLRSDPQLVSLEHKESWSTNLPFHRMKVRIKKEIVTMQVPDLRPTQTAGTYVKPEHWNALISDPSVVVIDTRNEYEVDLGTFAGAINPHIHSFSELPQWVKDAQGLNGALASATGSKPKVAMFCTGGIRCEKSTAYLRSIGFDEVYHLEGGILKYLETVPPESSLWLGECFVFDERVSVGHGLHRGPHQLCRACRQPLVEGALESPLFELGVSCPRCHIRTSEEQKSGARERQKQWELAKQRAQTHIGIAAPKSGSPGP